MMKRGHDFRDYICPDGIEKNSDYLKLGEKYCRVLFLKDYASYIKDNMVTELTDFNRNMMLSIDVVPVPTDEAVREVENRLLGVETNITNWQRRQNANNNFSAVVPYDMELQRKESKRLLTDIFWEMNEISSRTESKTETVITETDDGHGNIVQTETTQTRTYLYITVSHKTAEEMADQYGFDDEQRQMLSELLADENNSLWSQVLYGISVGDGEIVTVALSQVGNVGGQPYWSWYGFNSRVEWCACFVSWCANECGYIENGIIPKFAGCIQGSEWFKERGQWQDGSFTPEAGHIIFFDWEGDGLTDHVGIVERVENGTVYTVEGNSGDACRQNSYSIGSSVIYGYGIPAY